MSNVRSLWHTTHPMSDMVLDSIFESFALDIQYHITRCVDMGPSDVSRC